MKPQTPGLTEQQVQEKHVIYLPVTGALWDFIQILQEIFLLLLEELLSMRVEICSDGLVVERPQVHFADLPDTPKEVTGNHLAVDGSIKEHKPVRRNLLHMLLLLVEGPWATCVQLGKAAIVNPTYLLISICCLRMIGRASNGQSVFPWSCKMSHLG